MTAGLPGAGIGGVYYLLCALAMPLRETWAVLRGERRARWGHVLRQFAIACGIIGGMWATGIALSFVLTRTGSVATGLVSRNGLPFAPAVVRVSALAFSLGTLSLVLVAVQLARVLLAPAPAAPVDAAALAAIAPAPDVIVPRRVASGGRRPDSRSYPRLRVPQ